MNVPYLDLKPQYLALKSEIDERLAKVFDHFAFINGPEVAELEEKLNEFVGCKQSIACANGTDALLMGLMAAGVGHGDEVITTPFTFVATVEVIALLGAKPVYVDIDENTFNMDVSQIEAKVTKKTKAIIPVSLFGLPSDMDVINSVAKKHNLIVMEDGAQSFGATYKGKRSCNISTLSTTSFFPAKPLGTYGDGGAMFTQDEDLAKKLRQIRDHGSESRYYHTVLGVNGRLDSIQCAILLAKMGRYEWELQQRDRVAQTYTKGFAEVSSPDFQTPSVPDGYQSAWAQYTLRVPNRDAFQNKLKELGIPTSVHYPRIAPDQPAYRDDEAAEQLPKARRAAQEVISLPLYADMPSEHVDYVIEKVKVALKDLKV